VRKNANGNLTEQGSSYTGTEDSLTIAMSEDYRQYRYDLLNRLTEVLRYQDGDLVPVARYGYDINSLRIYKENGEGKTTRYVYDATGNRLETHTEETSSYYIFRGLRHVARRIVDNATQEEVRHYYGTDHLGSTVLVTGEAGEVLWSGETNPFGDSVSGGGTGSGESERLKYTGKDFDEDAGLYYFNARWYDPGTGRFITEDPIRYGANWYGYANNNPMRFVDPTGLRYEIDDLGDDLIVEDPTNGDAVSISTGRTDIEELEHQADLFIHALLEYENNKLYPFIQEQGLLPQTTSIQASGNRFRDDIRLAWHNLWNFVPALFNKTLNAYSTGYDLARDGLYDVTGLNLDDILLIAGLNAGGINTALQGIRDVGGLRNAIAVLRSIRYGAEGTALSTSIPSIQYFNSFRAFKRQMGRAGDNMDWHHIVEQNPANISQFGQRALQNTQNLVPIDRILHRRISALYSSIRPDITGSTSQTVRQWLSSQSYQNQMVCGHRILSHVLSGGTP
jgi:RHS repeat-associated protein